MPIKGQSPKEVIRTEMREFKHGQLHSGSKKGPLVKNRKQAIAIALSESRKAARGGSIEGDGKDDVTYGGTLPRSLQPITTHIPDSWMRKPHADGGGIRINGKKVPTSIGGLSSKKPWKGYEEGGAVNPMANPMADGGSAAPPPWYVRNEARNSSGMIKSAIPGRTDKIPMNVRGGSYILPADIPSALGQGNTMAGGSILDKMFTKGPYGMNVMKAKAGTSTKMARMSSLTKTRKSGYAEGGDTSATPIIAAGGEYVLSPEQVAQIGGGDVTRGHDILDQFVLQVRQKHIKTLRGLKPPKKD